MVHNIIVHTLTFPVFVSSLYCPPASSSLLQAMPARVSFPAALFHPCAGVGFGMILVPR